MYLSDMKLNENQNFSQNIPFELENNFNNPKIILISQISYTNKDFTFISNLFNLPVFKQA